MTLHPVARVVAGLAALCGLAVATNASAQSQRGLDARAARVIEHWTPERRAAAIPRDLVIDERGLGYLRAPGGVLVPYGHNISAQAAPGSGDTTGPTVTNMNPASNQTIGASYTFTANVSDTSGVKSVSFKIQKGSGTVQSFGASNTSGTVYSVSLSGFTDGTDWKWWVVAKDTVKGGNTTTTPAVNFSVSTGGGGGGGGGSGTPNAEWTSGGVVQNAAGRIYFEMPGNSRRTRWLGYVCSGTAVSDGTSGRSIILTAAHCVYDDSNKAFARNVLFIPNQAGTTGSGTDLNCSNDPIGCWAPQFGVVDNDWSNRVFPDNIPWDYAYYVVSDSGAHSGNASSSPALDGSVTAMSISFAAPSTGSVTHALGYSYSEDPDFMYCADAMTTEGAANWWIATCGLSGGSSGGPWVQPMTVSTGNGPVISVNSWGYTNQPGMAGPKLNGTSAQCLFGVAKSTGFGAVATGDGNEGVAVPNSTCP
jgi:hypothetical protein